MTHETPSNKTQLVRRFYPLPDAILFLYLLCIARQYLWVIGGGTARNVIAWSLSAIAAAVIIWFLTGARGAGWEATPSTVEDDWHSCLASQARAGRTFFGRLRIDWLWLAVVVAPLLFFFFLRAPFPALEFDHLNYHLVNTERSLRGWPMIDGDFFPGTLLVNPAPDMVFGVLKYAIGYRLAPILNIGVLLWMAGLLNEIIAPVIARKVVRYFAVLFIVATDQIAYIVNIYMVDLLSLPLLLAATLLTIRLRQSARPDRAIIKIALLLGISIAFKLTNAFFVIPILGLGLFELWTARRQLPRLPLQALVTAALASVLPAIFFFGYMFAETGNPVFPYYNKIFKSPFMLAINYRDQNLGPSSLLSKVFWPIVSFIYPTELGAMNAAPVYSGRLNLGFILSLCLLCWPRTPVALRRISFVMVLGCMLWSFSSGDLRYALLGEILGGVACCYILKYIFDQAKGKFAGAQLLKVRVAMALVFGFIGFQSLSGLWFGLVSFQCANERHFCDRVMQPIYTNRFSAATFKILGDIVMLNKVDFVHHYSYAQEARYLFRDREARDFFSTADQEQFRDVQLWINSSDGSSAYMALAAPDVPMISVAHFLNLFDYMQAPAARQRVRALIKVNPARKMYTIVQRDRYDKALADLAKVGLKPGPEREISIPLYSPNIRAYLLMIELTYSDDE